MPHTFMTGWRRTNTPKATVFIAVPTYGQPYAATVNSLNAAQHHLAASGYNGYMAYLAGMCHVDDARNNMCARFLQTEDATHLMFVDADVTFDSDAITKLLEHDEDMVAGIYPFKNDDGGFPVVMGEKEYTGEGLMEAKGVPGGFMCIKRAVIEKLTRINSKKGVWPEKADYHLPVVEIFHRTIEKGRSRRSGDYEFCDKVRRSGFKIMVEPNITFGHVGTKIWTGNFREHVMHKTGAYVAKAREIVQSGKDLGLDDFKALADAYGNKPFATDPIQLSVLHDLAAEHEQVLETGSGLSTLVMALADTPVVALEANRGWMGKTLDFADAIGMKVDGWVQYSPIVNGDHGKWYEYGHDRNFLCPDMIYIDGPKRDEPGMRARIMDYLPEVVRGAKTIVVDDIHDQDGRNTLDRLNKDFGFMFDLHQTPTHVFAVGTRDE